GGGGGGGGVEGAGGWGGGSGGGSRAGRAIWTAGHFQPLVEAGSGSATTRRSARLSSIMDTTLPFRTTHTSPPAFENARSSPAPVGRLNIVKVKRLFAAPPVKTQP